MGVTTWKCQKCSDIQQTTNGSAPQDDNHCTVNPPSNHNWGNPLTITWQCTRCLKTITTTDLTAVPNNAGCQGNNSTGRLSGLHNWLFSTESVHVRKMDAIEQLKSTFKVLLNEAKTDVKRPGIYVGTHFYDLGDELMWSNGNNGDPCGTDVFFLPPKKAGDTYTLIGVCPISGMDEYRIILV